MYPGITVPGEAGDILEQLGTKPKFWFGDGDFKLKAAADLMYPSNHDGT